MFQKEDYLGYADWLVTRDWQWGYNMQTDQALLQTKMAIKYHEWLHGSYIHLLYCLS